ncbi:MAG: hypothetical protein JOY93_10920, partial [Acidobacteriales bacterium]|nr:hypothetical protein [Terriglobales bacterium]
VLEKAAHYAVVTEVGPEVISGSTRMKAGTAQKMVLNMLSTGVMIRLGYVYGNLMINVHVKNKKLLERGLTILQLAAATDDSDAIRTRRTAARGYVGAAEINRDTAVQALRAAHNSVPVALLMLRCGLTREAAIGALKSAAGDVREAMANAIIGHRTQSVKGRVVPRKAKKLTNQRSARLTR